MNKATTLTFLFVTTERGRYRRQKKKQKKFCTSFLLKEKLSFTFLGPASKCGINFRKVTKEACTLKRITKIFFPLHCNKITRPAHQCKNNERDSDRFCCGHSVTRKFFNLPALSFRQAGVILLRCGEEVQKNLFEDGVGQFWKNSEQIFNPDKNGTGAIYLRAGIIRKVINANLFIWREARI